MFSVRICPCFFVKGSFKTEKTGLILLIMNKIRFAVLGCGVIAPTHIWAIDQNENAELTALCDCRRDRMEALAEGRGILLFEEWEEMLASPEIDAVAICLPHHLHAPALIDCLEAGKHVLCEKPLGINLEQLRSMEEAARKAREKGILAGGIFQHRFSPLVRETASLLKEGGLGELTEVSLDFLCTRTAEYYAADSWRGRWETEGGGLIINQAIHTVDLLIQLMGLPDRVEGTIGRDKMESIDVEDRAGASFLYDGRDIGSIRLVMENDLKTSWQPEIRIKGTAGELVLTGSEEFTCSDPEVTARLVPFAGEEEEKAPGKACYGSLHSRNYADFLEALQENRDPLVTLDSLAGTTEAVLAIYQSHFAQSPVSIPLDRWEEPETLKYQGDKR